MLSSVPHIGQENFSRHSFSSSGSTVCNFCLFEPWLHLKSLNLVSRPSCLKKKKILHKEAFYFTLFSVLISCLPWYHPLVEAYVPFMVDCWFASSLVYTMHWSYIHMGKCTLLILLWLVFLLMQRLQNNSQLGIVNVTVKLRSWITYMTIIFIDNSQLFFLNHQIYSFVKIISLFCL